MSSNVHPRSPQTASKPVTFPPVAIRPHVRGAILRDLREVKDRSLQFAASQVGVTEKTFRSWEQGGPIQQHNLEALAAYYDVDAADLIQNAPVKRRPQQLPQLDQIAAEVASMRVEIEGLTKQITDLRSWLARRLGSDESKGRSRRAG